MPQASYWLHPSTFRHPLSPLSCRPMTQRAATTETAAAIRVVLVDDHTLFRQGLRQSLQGQGIEIVGEGSNGAMGVKLISELRPDVVIMDLHMPIMGGIDATRAVVENDP